MHHLNASTCKWKFYMRVGKVVLAVDGALDLGIVAAACFQVRIEHSTRLCLNQI